MLLPLFTPDHAKWAALHGLEVLDTPRGWRVKIDAVCKHLTEDKRCAIHEKPEQPEICRTFKCSALDPVNGIEVEGIPDAEQQ